MHVGRASMSEKDPGTASSSAAILFADVKGYAVLVQRDEIDAYRRLKQARNLFRQIIGDYGGQIVDEAGDGFMLAFDDSRRAVDYALAIQRDLANAEAWQGGTGPFAFRIGIHAGTVRYDGEQLFGHTVIMAQRIQETTPPGRVCVSSTVHAELKAQSGLRFTSLGRRFLKNMEPAEVYCVDHARAEIITDLVASPPPPTLPSDDTMLAMLPFENQSGQPQDNLLCEGITTDIIERLSRFRDLSIIARSSAFYCRDLVNEPASVGQLLGVRYVALGAARRAGNLLRITVQLLEAQSGRLLWADRYDGSLHDVFAFQDEVADTIAARLATNISIAERRRILSARAPEISAYGLVLRGQELMLNFRQENNDHARHLFEAAETLDPSYGRVYAGLAHSYYLAWRYGWASQPDSYLDQATALALRAVSMDELDARGHAELGCTRLYKKQYPQALAAYERAIELNPNDADILADMADAVSAMGQPERAVSLLKKAIRLNPYQPDWYLWHLGDAQFNLGLYEDAIQSLTRMRDPTEAQRLLAACHALLGNLDLARHHAAEVRRAHPGFTLTNWRQVPPDVDSSTLERYFEGLRLAGLS